jgi:drug/metabolite transporter (DMT)-like permease
LSEDEDDENVYLNSFESKNGFHNPAFTSESEFIAAFSSDAESVIAVQPKKGGKSKIGGLKSVNSGDFDNSGDLDDNSGSESSENDPKSVKFNKLKEVRELFDTNDTWIARMSHFKAEKMRSRMREFESRNKIIEIVKIASIFTLPLFLSNMCFSEAILKTSPNLVNILCSLSGLFTLFLSTIFPSSNADRFSCLKFFCVILSINGVIFTQLNSSKNLKIQDMVQDNTVLRRPQNSVIHWLFRPNSNQNRNANSGEANRELNVFKDVLQHQIPDAISKHKIPPVSEDDQTQGVLWSVFSAVIYSVYLVSLSRQFKTESKNLPVALFFGFVGLFVFLLLWPGLAVVHFVGFEEFAAPDSKTCYLLIINGLIGSVIAEVMWLYGVLYTSSLIGTMALTLQIPLSIIADSFVRGASYSPMFNIGATCIFMAFVFVTIATHTMMPRNKIKVPRKVRHFCCCTCHKCKTDHETTNEDSSPTSSVQNKLGKLFRRKQQNDDTTEMKTLLADDSSDDDS